MSVIEDYPLNDLPIGLNAGLNANAELVLDPQTISCMKSQISFFNHSGDHRTMHPSRMQGSTKYLDHRLFVFEWFLLEHVAIESRRERTSSYQ